MKKKHLLSLSLFLLQFTFAQTGPGGVGLRNGTSSLDIWLRGNDINADNDLTNNPPNGSSVSTWADFSGNSNHFTQSGNNRPTFSDIGAFDAVNFNASLSTAQFMNSSLSGIFRNASVFFVVNTVNDGNANSLFDHSSASLRVEQHFNRNRIGFTRYGIADYVTNIPSPFGINAIISFHKSSTSSNLEVRSNNNSHTINIGSATTGIPVARIGRNSNGTDEASGNFYEIIFFNSQINTAQKIIIENYLSAKYGSIGISMDIYNEDEPGAGNYDHEVAGIGRINSSNQHNDSQGTGIVRILNPTNLDDNEFLFWGHDNQPLQMNTNIDTPSSIKNRLTRVWRVSESNTSGGDVDVGNIEMRFDLTGLSNISTNNLRLLIDTNNNGNFNDDPPISGAVNLGNNIYAFNNISSISNNTRFTLGLALITIITNKRITHRVIN
ncbi:hypothetical protein [Tenacibaculum sp. C7A-26P2]|uniref:hypothetical protein n=1 Tax=Tenacibaculum sp. C7A-26P2 TaxID=3447504 RepID=UPI003F82BAEE